MRRNDEIRRGLPIKKHIRRLAGLGGPIVRVLFVVILPVGVTTIRHFEWKALATPEP